MPQNGNARKVFSWLQYLQSRRKTKKIHVYTREKKYEISRTVKGKGKRKKAPAIFFKARCEKGA